MSLQMSTNKRLVRWILAPVVWLAVKRFKRLADLYYFVVTPVVLWLLRGSPEHRDELA